jgi:hypothetical protein
VQKAGDPDDGADDFATPVRHSAQFTKLGKLRLHPCFVAPQSRCGASIKAQRVGAGVPIVILRKWEMQKREHLIVIVTEHRFGNWRRVDVATSQQTGR